MKFSDLHLAEPILRAVAADGYTTATPIQAKAIPFALEGRDVLGSAQTGTGKTAAFALPILQRLSASSKGTEAAPATPTAKTHGHPHEYPRRNAGASSSTSKKARALILCPTRELATQIADGFRSYGKNLHLKHVVIFGGVGQNPQVVALRRTGVDIIVATPGRLLDLMNQGHVDLTAIEILVLDEADRMLDMGFIHDIRRIVTKLPNKRQTMFFSATMPPEIRKLADTILRDPAVVQVAPQATPIEAIKQSVYMVKREDKPDLLAHLFKELPMSRAIVFTRTKHGADRVVRRLHSRGIRAEAIHGNKSQNARQRALDNFKAGKTPLLIATDIAARGIDVDNISHVVNYDLTHEPETYVHRIGRTARAGASGAAVSFCDSDERSNLRAIEKLIRKSIPVETEMPKFDKRSQQDVKQDHEEREQDRAHSGSRGGGSRDGSSRGGGSRSGSDRGGRSSGHRSSHASHPRREGGGAGHGGGQSGRDSGERREQSHSHAAHAPAARTSGQGSHSHAAQPAHAKPRRAHPLERARQQGGGHRKGGNRAVGGGVVSSGHSSASRPKHAPSRQRASHR